MRLHTGIVRITIMLACVSAAAFTRSPLLFGQQLFWSSASSLPGNLTRLEYENLKALRKMPDFQALRKAYAGNFEYLERWLRTFGLKEGSVAELLVGVEGGNEGGRNFAIAEGEFSPLLPTAGFSPHGRLVPTKIGGFQAYCKGSADQGGPCAMFRGQSWAALGSKQFLDYVIEDGDGVTEPLSSEPTLTDLVATVPSDAPLWGIARGAAALTWLRGSLPFADSLPIVWLTIIDGLDGLSYSVVPSEDEVRISVKLEYKNSEHATFEGALFKGVKTIEEVMWLGAHQSGSDPLLNAQIDVDDRIVSLDLSVAYQELVSGVPLGSQRGR